MDTKTRSSIIVGMFACAIITVGFLGYSDSLFNTADDVITKSKQSSQSAVRSVTQTVKAQNSCPSYAQQFPGTGDTCHRSQETTFTVVLATTSDPTAVCNIDPESPNEGDDVTFSAASSSDSDGSITNYSWDVSTPAGDGGTGAISWTYPDHPDATTTAELTVTDNDGNTGSTTCSVCPGCAGSVNAQCDVAPTSTTTDGTVTFDGSGSTASSSIVSYSWVFGDGNSATTTSATTNHSYSSTGNYTGSVTVTSADGNTGTAACPQVEIATATNSPPTADCDTFPNDPKENDTITFDGSGSSDSDGSIPSDGYDWTVTDPDGNTLSSGSSQTYDVSNAEVGTYDASLVVTDNDGDTSSTETCSINVDSQPTCVPGTSDTSGTSGEAWVNVTGVSNTPRSEGSNVNIFYNTNNVDSCTEYDNLGDDPEENVTVRCESTIAPTSSSWWERQRSGGYQICDVYNVTPNADDDTYQMTVDSTLNGSLDASDPVDSLNYAITSAPSNGSITSGPDSSGNFTYEPNENYYNGANADSFSYRVNDGDGGTDSGTITIDIYNNEPEAVIDGENSLDYCEDKQNLLTYDGSNSNDEQSSNPTGNKDGDEPNGLQTDKWNWSDSQNEGSVVGSQPYQKYRLEGPINWPNTTNINLDVTDDEGETGSDGDTTKSVTINTPDYQTEITVPSTTPRMYMTANSTETRSTKATISVENINPATDNFEPSYNLKDHLELDFSDTQGVSETAFTSTSTAPTATEPGKFTFWVENTSIPRGTYTVNVEVALDHPDFPDVPECTYDEAPTEVQIPLRVQNAAEF